MHDARCHLVFQVPDTYHTVHMTQPFEAPKQAEHLEGEFKKAAEQQIATLREMVKSGELKTEPAQEAARVAARGTDEIVHPDQA